MGSNPARFVLIVWFLVVLVLTQSYTASLTSMLTVQKLQPTITDIDELIRNKEPIGYMKGSFVYGFLKKMDFEESRFQVFDSAEQMNELLSKGSGKGGIVAAFHEIPYIKLFLGKYCSKYMMVGPTYKADGFGFVCDHILSIHYPIYTCFFHALTKFAHFLVCRCFQKALL